MTEAGSIFSAESLHTEDIPAEAAAGSGSRIRNSIKAGITQRRQIFMIRKSGGYYELFGYFQIRFFGKCYCSEHI
jgi:hypothetical protein